MVFVVILCFHFFNLRYKMSAVIPHFIENIGRNWSDPNYYRNKGKINAKQSAWNILYCFQVFDKAIVTIISSGMLISFWLPFQMHHVANNVTHKHTMTCFSWEMRCNEITRIIYMRHNLFSTSTRMQSLCLENAAINELNMSICHSQHPFKQIHN